MGRRGPIIQSMFLRRLLFLAAGFSLGMGALAWQFGRLTIAEGENHRADARTRLIRTKLLPTTRGRILDRKGRVLAQDRPSYEVAIDYRVLTGEWARAESWKIARGLHFDDWPDLSSDERQAFADRYRIALDRHVDGALGLVARTAGVERPELDETIAGVVRRVERMHESTSARRLRAALAGRTRDGLATPESELERLRQSASQPIAEQKQAHPVLTDLPDDIGFRLLSLIDVEAPVLGFLEDVQGADEVTRPILPGVRVRNAARREHPFGVLDVVINREHFPGPIASEEPVTLRVRDVASPVLGTMRERLYAEDTHARAAALDASPELRARALTNSGADRGRYLEGDSIGSTGVEASSEHALRGLRGVRTENLQTGEVSVVPATSGRDVTLTLDIALQARVRAIMDPALGLAVVQPWHKNSTVPEGTYLYGGAVVLDVASGEILALVSTPTPPTDGDWADAYGLDTDQQIELFSKLTSPGVNKAIAKPYPPGSIAKAAVLCGAAERGYYHRGERIPATGHLLPNRPDAFRSWIYKEYGITHRDQLGHDPDGIDALTVSSNVFFYNLGRRLGSPRLAQLYADVGVGDTFNLGIGPEWPGRVGPIDGPGDGTDLAEWDAILMGIGQGPITWTPVHAAATYAAIARGGVWVSPRLVRDGKAPETREIAWPEWAIDDTLEGLRRVVAGDPNFATGRFLTFPGGGKEEIFNAQGITIHGKTGTATAPPIVFDPDDEGPAQRQVFMEGHHSWFVVLAGEDGAPPRYAVAVVIDYAGSGGRVSGPIANQIVHALIDEGYLVPERSVRGDDELAPEQTRDLARGARP